MAGTDNTLEESANFYRLISLVVDVGSEVLRDVLLQLVKPRTLEAVLQANINTINKLRGKVLFPEQYALLINVPPNAEDFDISLLVIIFRNICPNVPPPSLGWKTKKPDRNDFSLAADLQRLKNIRNSVYAHRNSTQVTHADFERIWSDLSDVIDRISKHGSGKHQNIRQRIQLLKHKNLDPESERGRMLEIFQNWQKQEQDEEYKALVLQRLDKQVQLLRLYTIYTIYMLYS